MSKFTTFAILALAASANAFAPASFPARTAVSSTAQKVLLSEEDTAAILGKAHDCAEGECSVDDVSGLIAELKEQQHDMSARLEEMMNMVAHLQKINVDETRKKDEVREYVRDLLRVFDTSSSGFATGFSGDIGKGSTTAYKALNPKPWKASP
eukprot:CAMPEP_0194108032 /NCGR_PEP_ID=MMETSP0150-20130528/7805_1 /TAXON_ID=122233 /ORGANISM="Chaetoceros debilis, Strain MM31A-1" /LENGTH=152 /DNA_ID=CAMNT_0038796623 /DNA_START=34 /DNA_END=492 /DNA_ORIENTATION=-